MKEGQEIKCPHCEGRKGKTVLLYYWVDCYLCLGVGKIRIDKILKVDKGDTKATFSVNLNNSNVPKWVTKTDWLF